MKILFIQKWKYEQEGIMSIAAMLRKHDHTVSVLVDCLEKDTISSIRKNHTDLICVACSTAEEGWALSLLRKLKESFDVLTVLGGIHPTALPEVINNEGVDIICRGEGEYAILELVERLEHNQDIRRIRNLWVKNKGVVYRNTLRPLVQKLDTLPFPDRTIYQGYSQITRSPFGAFIFSRGCIYNCNFCYSASLKRLYGVTKHFVRWKSVSYSIDEIDTTLSKYPKKTIHFTDSIFGVDRKWRDKFLRQYRKRIGVPFTCNIRPEMINDQYVRNLRDAGCFGVLIGIETGNERIRNRILNKNMINQHIVRAALILKKHKLDLLTENMFGLPNETALDALETVRLNREIKADYVLSNFLQLFPGLPIVEYLREHNLIQAGNKASFYGMSSPMVANQENNAIIKIHCLFHYLVKIPIPLSTVMAVLPILPIQLLRHLRIYNQWNHMSFHRLSKMQLLENWRLRMWK
jgi:anaerobic magnesium-protoporphyrin IX monomethyl ester cyclase